MQDRIILIKLNAQNTTPEARESFAQESLARLSSIPGAQHVNVGIPSDAASLKSWDLSVVVRSKNKKDLDAFLEHPAYADYLDTFLPPRVEVLKAWNFGLV